MKKSEQLDPPELSQEWFDKALPAREVLPVALLAVLRSLGQGRQRKVNALLRRAVTSGKV